MHGPTAGGDASATPTRRPDRFDQAVSALWLIAGLGVCAYAVQLGLYTPSGPDSGFFVLIAGAVMALAGAVLLAGSARAVAPPDRWPRGAGARRVLLVLAGTAVLILLMRWLGFVLAALLMMPLLLRVIERRSIVFMLAVGWGAAIATFLLFGKLLGTTLPRGPWGF